MTIIKRHTEYAVAIVVAVGTVFFLFISPGSIPFFGHQEVAEEAGPQELQVGEREEIENLIIEPLSILEDSRCPIGVQCIWEGRIVAEVKLSIGESSEKRSIAFRETISYGEYLVTLINVFPEKVEGQQIKDEDYKLTFEVKKAALPNGEAESAQ